MARRPVDAPREDEPATRSPAWPPLLALAVLALVLVVLAFDAGGYFADDHLGAGAAIFVTVGLLLLVAPPEHRLTGMALGGLGALAGYAAWVGLSATWSPQPDDALADFRLALVYVGILALAILAGGSGRRARLLPWTALLICAVVVGAGLASRLFPDLIGPEPGEVVPPGFRLSYPLTYWNAFGMMAAFGGVLATGLASDPRAPAVNRALAAGLAVPLLTAMYLSLSRGAWLAVIVGAVVLVLLSPYRFSVLLTGAIVGIPFVLAIARLQSYPGLLDGPPAAPAGDGGALFATQLAILTGAAAAVQLVAAGIRSSAALVDLGRRTRGPVLGGAAAAVAVAALIIYVGIGDRVEGRSARAVEDASSWIDRQWDDFLLTSSFSAGATDRLLTSRGTRSDIYRVALDGFGDHPLYGDGAGGWEWRWYQTREVQEDTREPHSLWLGALGELGLVGAGLLLGFVGCLIAGVARGLRKPAGLRRGETAAVAAAVAAYVLHAGVDWDWEIPALTGTALLAAGALLPSGQRRRRRRRSPLAVR